MKANVEAAVKIKLITERLSEEDEAKAPPEAAVHIRRARELYQQYAGEMLKDVEGMKTVLRLDHWFEEDFIDIWSKCEVTSRGLAERSPPINESPGLVAAAALEVLQRLNIPEEGDLDFRHFSFNYGSCRGMTTVWKTRQDVIEHIVKYRKYLQKGSR